MVSLHPSWHSSRGSMRYIAFQVPSFTLWTFPKTQFTPCCHLLLLSERMSSVILMASTLTSTGMIYKPLSLHLPKREHLIIKGDLRDLIQTPSQKRNTQHNFVILPLNTHLNWAAADSPVTAFCILFLASSIYNIVLLSSFLTFIHTVLFPSVFWFTLNRCIPLLYAKASLYIWKSLQDCP